MKIFRNKPERLIKMLLINSTDYRCRLQYSAQNGTDNTAHRFEMRVNRTDRNVQIFLLRPNEELSLFPLRSTALSGQITDANSC